MHISLDSELILTSVHMFYLLAICYIDLYVDNIFWLYCELNFHVMYQSKPKKD